MNRRTPKREIPMSATACSVIVFPLHKRIGKVRHVALLYSRRQGRDADSYWRVQCNALFRKLLALGCTPAQADTELSAFRDAVSGELTRITYFDTTSNRPDGAA